MKKEKVKRHQIITFSRSLEVLHQKGKPHSKILEEQHNSKGGSSTGGALRFSNTLILKLECEKVKILQKYKFIADLFQAILEERLNSRVDKMVQQGLLQELTNFHKLYNENRIKNSEYASRVYFCLVEIFL